MSSFMLPAYAGPRTAPQERKELSVASGLLAAIIGWRVGSSISETIAWLYDRQTYWEIRRDDLLVELRKVEEQLALIQQAKQDLESKPTVHDQWAQ